MALPKQPTGIRTETASDSIIVSWFENDESDIKGYNIYNSTTSGGGVSGYIKINPELITIPLKSENIVISSEQTVITALNVKTTTTVENIEPTNIFGFKHTNLLDGKAQYYVITAVNNTNEESLYSIEVSSVPMNLTTNLVKFPIRETSDVTQSIINRILDRNENVDVKPGTMTRDIHIDPQAAEFGHLYVQIDFLSRSQSFLTLLELDDPEDTGSSIAVADDPYKLALKAAYGFQSDADVQQLIDVAFDRLAGNQNVFRFGAQPSIGEVTFYTSVKPLADINIPVGSTASTSSTASSQSITFATTVAASMLISSIDSYFNDATQRYEITVPVQASTLGAETNVNSGTIVNSGFGLLQVTNSKPTQGGEDSESNNGLATRAMLSFTSLDLGTLDGYLRTAIETHGVEDVLVVDAEHPLMQRDYDEVRMKHIFGKVDIYFKGSRLYTANETFGLKYKKIKDDIASISNAADQKILVTNPLVTPLSPIFMVQEIFNVSRAGAYDLLGNCDLFKNLVPMPKSSYDVDLTAGDIVFHNALVLGDQIKANYKYKVLVSNEPIILAAIGGENAFSVTQTPVAALSETIRLTRGITTSVITRNVDYTINYDTGLITILNSPTFVGGGLVAGDALTIDYDKINSITGEIVVAVAAGGETTASLINGRVLESVLIESDGMTLNIDQNNTANALLGMASGDIINVTYYYRDINTLVLANQPVDEIVTVIDSSGNVLQQDVNYEFNKVDDILLEGNSVKSIRNLGLIYSETNGLLSGLFSRFSETLNLVGFETKKLLKKGIDIDTVIVKDLSGLITYAVGADYTVVEPSESSGFTTIARTTTSSITSGQNVVVEYRFGELITVNYNVNSLIKNMQDRVNASRHITADVLVKQANRIDIDLEFSIRLTRNASEPVVKDAVRTRLGQVFSSKNMGERVSQSDVISIIDQTPGVDYVFLPLTKMVVADGTHIAYEQLNGASWSIHNVGISTAYKTLPETLVHSTGGSASDNTLFWRVSEDDRQLLLVDAIADVSGGLGRAHIAADGTVYVSTFENEDPTAHKITVAYNVLGETGSNDITTTDLDYLNLNSIVIHII